MSIDAWKRRLERQGLVLSIYDGSASLTEYTVLVRAVREAWDRRFPEVIGVAWAETYTEAIPLAVADFRRKEEEREREQALLALAGQPAPKASGGRVAHGR